MGSKPQAETTTNSTSSFSPPPDVLANYRAVTQQAQNVAATPYQPYGGELVAPINNQTGSGINTINAQNGAQGGYNRGAVQDTILGGRSVVPTTYGQANVNQYLSPYINDVVKATEGQIQNQNQQQSSALTGNAISSGAFGGDRSGVAQAALAGQQDIASNQAIAGLYNQGFLNAQGEFNTQQAAKIGAQENTDARRLAAGQQFGALGQQHQNEGLTQGAAQTQAGGLEQQTQQAYDTALYNQFLQKQAYPFQTTGWLANIVEGIGSQSGGTATGSSDQTQFGSGLSSILGGGLALASFLNRGGRVGRYRGGVVPRLAVGGGLGAYMDSDSPVRTSLDPDSALGAGSWVVPANLPIGHTMPGSTGAPQGGGGSSGGSNQMGSQLLSKGLGMFNNSSLGDAFNDFTQDNFGFARGGGVAPFRRRGFGGGVVPFRRRRFDDGGNVDAGPGNVYNPDDSELWSAPSFPSEPRSYSPDELALGMDQWVPRNDPEIANLPSKVREYIASREAPAEWQSSSRKSTKEMDVGPDSGLNRLMSDSAYGKSPDAWADNLDHATRYKSYGDPYQTTKGERALDALDHWAGRTIGKSDEDAAKEFPQIDAPEWGLARGGVASSQRRGLGGVIPFRRRFDDGGDVGDALSVGPDGLLTAADLSTPAALSSPESAAASNAVVPSEWNAPQTLPDIAKSGVVPIQTTTGGLAVTTPHVDPTNDNGMDPSPAAAAAPSMEWLKSRYGQGSPELPPVRAELYPGVREEFDPNPAPGASRFPSLAPTGTVFGQAAPEAGGAPLGKPAPVNTTTDYVLKDNATGTANIDNGSIARGAVAAGVAPNVAAGSGVAPSSASGESLASPLADPTYARMIGIESGGRQFNADGSVKTSPKGAVGIAQVMPGTGPEAAAYAGLPWDPKRFVADKDYNLALGAAYYQHQLETFGSPDKAAAAYNAGPAATQDAINKAERTGGSYLQYLPKETQAYVARATTGEVPALDAITSASPSRGFGVAQTASAQHSHGLLGGLHNLLWGDDNGGSEKAASSGDTSGGGGGLFSGHMSDATRTGLLAAGLGIMGGTSMNPWTNIGQGGLKGIQTMQAQQGLNSEIGLRGAQTANQQAEAIMHMTEAQKQQYGLEMMKKGLADLEKDQNSAASAGEKGGPPRVAPVAAPAAAAAAPTPTPASAPSATTPSTPVAASGAPIAPAAAAATAPAAAPAAPAVNDPWANWTVPDDQNPDVLRQQAALLNRKAAVYSSGAPDVSRQYENQAQQKLLQAHNITTTGRVIYPDGHGGTVAGYLPGWIPNQAKAEAATEAAKSQAALPADYSKESLKGITENETAMGGNYGPIAQSKQRLQTIATLMQKYQTGHLSEAKADAVALARALHIPLPNEIDANPAAFQEFVKNATANVFNQASQLKGRILVTELEGLKAANASPDLQPEANAAIIAQGIGLLDAEKAHADDYFAWRGPSKGAAPTPTDVAQFNSGWFSNHNIQGYVDAASKEIGYQGQTVPPPQELKVGQVYQNGDKRGRWDGTRFIPVP